LPNKKQIEGNIMNALKMATLADLKRQSGTATKQSVIALEMSVQEPAISKLERKRVSNVQIDKLQKYLDAIGATLSLSVTLADGTTITMED
jgi:predicted XRE-type DNA-binding protein